MAPVAARVFADVKAKKQLPTSFNDQEPTDPDPEGDPVPA